MRLYQITRKIKYEKYIHLPKLKCSNPVSNPISLGIVPVKPLLTAALIVKREHQSIIMRFKNTQNIVHNTDQLQADKMINNIIPLTQT